MLIHLIGRNQITVTWFGILQATKVNIPLKSRDSDESSISAGVKADN